MIENNTAIKNVIEWSITCFVYHDNYINILDINKEKLLYTPVEISVCNDYNKL